MTAAPPFRPTPRSLVSHTWDEPGTYTVTLTADDGDGGRRSATAQVLVQGPTIDAGPDLTGNEGQPVSFVRPFDGPQYVPGHRLVGLRRRSDPQRRARPPTSSRSLTPIATTAPTR